MFGFLNPRPHRREYRRVYARLCQAQQLHYGFWALPFHSYEAVFLYQCAIDAGAVNVDQIPWKTCCKLMARGSLRKESDAAVGRFCSSLAMLLTSIKLEDDIRDSGSIAARITRWILRKRLSKACRYFQDLDPRFQKNVAQLLENHHRLEVHHQQISLEEYVEPTAQAFGYVFGLIARLPKLDSHRDTFIQLGQKLGAAIIAFDCAADWHRDRRRGEFNPLPDENAVEDAHLLSAHFLEEASNIARMAFGEESQAAKTLDSVRLRLLRFGGCVVQPQVKKPITLRTLLNRGIRKASAVFRLALAPVLSSKEMTPEEELLPKDRILTPEEREKIFGKDDEETKNRRQKKSEQGCNWCDGCLCLGYSCDCGSACAGGGEAAGCCGDGCSALECLGACSC